MEVISEKQDNSLHHSITSTQAICENPHFHLQNAKVT
jgi:hypothetical protein